MPHDYSNVIEYVSQNFKRQLPPSGMPQTVNCVDSFKQKIEMISDFEYTFKREDFDSTDRKLFASYIAFTFGGIDFETYCKMWSIFCDKNGIVFSREYILKIDSAFIYNLSEYELRFYYDLIRKDFLISIYKIFGEYMHTAQQPEYSNEIWKSDIFSDLYDDRGIGSIRQLPISYEEFLEYGWTTKDYLTYMQLCKNLYSASIEDSKVYFDMGFNKKRPNVIAAIINIKRFLYTKEIFDITDWKYYAEKVELSFSFGLNLNIHYSERLPISVRGEYSVYDGVPYILDFDYFRMRFERALTWNDIGENYCLMNYVDGYFETAQDYASFDIFLDLELPKYDYDCINLLINRLQDARRIHRTCYKELTEQLNDDVKFESHEELSTTIKNCELESSICFCLNDFLDQLSEKFDIIPSWINSDTLYIYDYIYKSKTSGHTRKHKTASATAVLTGKNNSEIKLDVEYCTQCKKFFISYALYEAYRKKYGMLIGKLCMDSNEVSGSYDNNFSEYSPLKLNGYSVNQDDGYSKQDRQYILSKVIDNRILQKSEVIRYLDHFIHINGRKTGNEIALSKWKQDLEFVLQYKSPDQDEFETSQIIQH